VPSRPRFPRGVYDVGTEPDPRFSLANERTFLAWVRTALALVASGVAVDALASDVRPGFRLATSVLLVLLGATVPLLAWFTWMDVERALRQSAPLPASRVALPVAIGIGVASFTLVLGILVR
jgi:putative membrane protein